MGTAARRAGKTGALMLALALAAGCAAPGPGTAPEAPRAGPVRGDRTPPAAAPAPRGADPAAESFTINFDDRLAPGVFDAELLARRDQPKGTQGLWATVAGLRRAERARITVPATGASVEVALFNGPVRRGEIRISNAAAVLLGIAAAPTPVRVTALRREAVIVTP